MGLFLLQITSIHLRLAQKKRKCISFYNWKLQGLASGKDEPKNPPNLPGICFSIFFYSLGWLSFMLDFFSSTFSPRAENIPETWSFLGSLSLWRQKKRLLVTQPIPPRTPIGPCLDLLAFLVSREWSALSGQLDHLRHPSPWPDWQSRKTPLEKGRAVSKWGNTNRLNYMLSPGLHQSEVLLILSLLQDVRTCLDLVRTSTELYRPES